MKQKSSPKKLPSEKQSKKKSKSHKSDKQAEKINIEKSIVNSDKAKQSKQSKQSTLEDTICKIIQSELKLIFPALITQDSKANALK